MKTVLVIEDDIDLRDLVILVLGMKDFDVNTAANGREGLARVQDAMPDLILLDMTMPVMSGSEFAAEYRTHYGTRAPVVVMTAAEHAARRAQEIGAEDFLAKPFTPDELVRVVEKHIRL